MDENYHRFIKLLGPVLNILQKLEYSSEEQARISELIEVC
jgi:hypothetical protein